MKTLYVTDLDGTLLRSDETLSKYTIDTINELVNRGMLFSYATARSYNTAQKVTKGLNAQIPLIVYNGAFIKDNVTRDILVANYFDDDIKEVLSDLLNHDIYPIVYATFNGVEKFSYVWDKCNQDTKAFIKTREGDNRDHPVKNISELYHGDLFYISCIDDEKKLAPFYTKYKKKYHCIFSKDTYTQAQWLEFMPLQASKAHAIKQLKEVLGCDKVVVFGDGKNDIDMFEMADESYAVANGDDILKAIATDVIASNDEDAVAKWLMEHFE